MIKTYFTGETKLRDRNRLREEGNLSSYRCDHGLVPADTASPVEDSVSDDEVQVKIAHNRRAVAIASIFILAVVLAIGLWSISLFDVSLADISDYGLVSVLPPTFFIGLAILACSFCFLVSRPDAHPAILAVHVVGLIIILHGTTALLYDVPRYAWTYKHVGVVDYILRHGSVNPNVDIYHNWPGFFSLTAFASQALGIDNLVSVVGWAPAFFNLLYFLPLLFLFRSLTNDRRLAWLALWFFYSTNWVGQDYYAPQAMSYFFYIAILAICLRWFVPKLGAADRYTPKYRFLSPVVSLLNRGAPESFGGDTRERDDRRIVRLVLMGVVIILFSTIVASHQLTPFAAILCVAALVILRRCDAMLLPVFMCAITATWIFFAASTFVGANLQWIVQSIGGLFDNIHGNVSDITQSSPGRVFTVTVTRGLTAGLWGLALIGAIRRFRSGHRDLPVVIVAAAPFLLIGLQTYGGEMVFRIYLYTLPAMAFLAAATLLPSIRAKLSKLTMSLIVLVSLTLIGSFLFAYFAKEKANYFTHAEFQTIEHLYTVAPEGSLIISGSPDMPLKYKDYEKYTFENLTDNEDFRRGKLSSYGLTYDPADPDGAELAYIERAMADLNYPAAYLIIDRAQMAYTDLLDMMPDGKLNSIRLSLIRSPKFKVLYSNEDVTVFALGSDVRGGAKW